MITELYVDGGVIATNPSMIGGTYAYLYVNEEGQTEGAASVVTAAEMGSPVTNNQTEMLALIYGLESLPDDFKGTVFSDSAVTLGRVFQGWKWSHIPEWMHKRFRAQRTRLVHWDEIHYVLLDGHPTKKQLETGVGKRGHPVSIHNVWCDHACGRVGTAYLEQLGKDIAVEVPA